jgi:hypothetical protein
MCYPLVQEETTRHPKPTQTSSSLLLYIHEGIFWFLLPSFLYHVHYLTPLYLTVHSKGVQLISSLIRNFQFLINSKLVHMTDNAISPIPVNSQINLHVQGHQCVAQSVRACIESCAKIDAQLRLSTYRWTQIRNQGLELSASRSLKTFDRNAALGNNTTLV